MLLDIQFYFWSYPISIYHCCHQLWLYSYLYLNSYMKKGNCKYFSFFFVNSCNSIKIQPSLINTLCSWGASCSTYSRNSSIEKYYLLLSLLFLLSTNLRYCQCYVNFYARIVKHLQKNKVYKFCSTYHWSTVRVCSIKTWTYIFSWLSRMLQSIIADRLLT